MREFLLATVLVLVCMGTVQAITGDSINYLNRYDTIFLSTNGFQEKIFIHQIAPKQTLYSLAKFYGLTTRELYYYNPGLEGRQVSVGTSIHIPIPNSAILRYKPKDYAVWRYIPIFYVVRKGDTVYRIAKNYFRMTIPEMMERNNLEEQTLSVGQILHVGWMKLGGISEHQRRLSGGPLAERNRAMRQVFMYKSNGRKIYDEQGAAAWKNSSKDDADFYALHLKAPLNSVIEVTNPMTRRRVYAKVVGRIPITTYDENVKVILSPLAAKFLGAKDPRFFVKVRYLR